LPNFTNECFARYAELAILVIIWVLNNVVKDPPQC